MSFSDHKITAFTHRIADLPDQPNLPADELKARFDSSPEELRQGLNAVCDDADRLEERVSGIIAETFGDTIDKSMLSTELAAELDAKAVETSVASRIAAEAAARAAADSALEQELEQQIAQKCEVYCGTYYGNNEEYQDINLGFYPKVVIVATYGGYNVDRIWETGVQIATREKASYMLQITQTGFRALYPGDSLNGIKTGYNPYFYIRFK